jgi:protein-S-isoprenylcysteine O-methyltransferase Ste14
MKLRILIGSGRKIVPVVYIGSGIYSTEEEKILLKIFGEAWNEYCRKVKLPWL